MAEPPQTSPRRKHLARISLYWGAFWKNPSLEESFLEASFLGSVYFGGVSLWKSLSLEESLVKASLLKDFQTVFETVIQTVI